MEYPFIDYVIRILKKWLYCFSLQICSTKYLTWNRICTNMRCLKAAFLSKHFSLQPFFFQRLGFFIFWWVSWAPRGKFLKFGSPDHWKMYFRHTCWLQITLFIADKHFPQEYYGLVIKYTKSYHPNRCIKIGNKPQRRLW